MVVLRNKLGALFAPKAKSVVITSEVEEVWHAATTKIIIWSNIFHFPSKASLAISIRGLISKLLTHFSKKSIGRKLFRLKKLISLKKNHLLHGLIF